MSAPAIFDRDADAMARVAADLGGPGYAGDVTDAPALEAAIDDAASRMGGIGIVIPNAGISEARPGLLHEMPVADRDSVVAVKLGGVYNTLRPALRHMVGQGHGKVIAIGSMFGLAAAGIFPRPAHSAAKGAVVGLTRELALEYAPHNIQVNAIIPGFFRTQTRPRSAELARKMADYTPLGLLAEAEELKGTVVYLASPATDYMTGNLLVIDGGILAR